MDYLDHDLLWPCNYVIHEKCPHTFDKPSSMCILHSFLFLVQLLSYLIFAWHTFLSLKKPRRYKEKTGRGWTRAGEVLRSPFCSARWNPSVQLAASPAHARKSTSCYDTQHVLTITRSSRFDAPEYSSAPSPMVTGHLSVITNVDVLRFTWFWSHVSHSQSKRDWIVLLKLYCTNITKVISVERNFLLLL